jgi:hypothetical protein
MCWHGIAYSVLENIIKTKIHYVMKKVLFASLALVGSLTLANAQTTESTPATESSTTTSTTVATQQDQKAKIKSEDLPEAVKKSINSEDYRGWLISAAYEDKAKGQYEVELKNGAEVKTVRFDKEGKKID